MNSANFVIFNALPAILIHRTASRVSVIANRCQRVLVYQDNLMIKSMKNGKFEKKIFCLITKFYFSSVKPAMLYVMGVIKMDAWRAEEIDIWILQLITVCVHKMDPQEQIYQQSIALRARMEYWQSTSVKIRIQFQ